MCCRCHCRGCCLLSCFLTRFSPKSMMLEESHPLICILQQNKTFSSTCFGAHLRLPLPLQLHWYCNCSNRKPEVLPCASVNLQHLCLFGLCQASTELLSSTQPSAIIRAKIQSQLGVKFAAFECGIGSG